MHTNGPPREGSIVAAAVYCDGFIFSLPPPARHCDVMALVRETMPGRYVNQDEQGFLTSLGRFVRRKPAVWIAQEAGQITEPKWGDQLYSEDLW